MVAHGTHQADQPARVRRFDDAIDRFLIASIAYSVPKSSSSIVKQVLLPEKSVLNRIVLNPSLESLPVGSYE